MNRETKFAEWIAFNGYTLNNFQNGVGWWSNIKTLKNTSDLLEMFNKENPIKDRLKKGAYKLSYNDLISIWTMYNKGLNHRVISDEFVSERGLKVSRRHISSILQKKRWKKEMETIMKSSVIR
jgi:hypothetical protein